MKSCTSRIICLVIGSCLWLLVGCRTPSPTPTPESTLPPTLAATQTIEPIPSPSPAVPTPTLALPPSIQMDTQTIDESGKIIVARAYAPEGGWLVIHAGTSTSEELLGYVALQAGSNNAIEISVDPFSLPAEAWVTIHQDITRPGSFDFPSDDPPLELSGRPVAKLFAIQLELDLPMIVATDQAVKTDGLLQIEQVVALKAGWLAIYNQTEAQELLGFVPVDAGTTEQLVVPIHWRLAMPNVRAVLLEDAGTIGRFQADDPPVLFQNNPVALNIHLTLPPDMIIFDQPMVNQQVVVERAISEGPGWVALYEDGDGGELLTIIGFAPLQAGLNEHVPVPIIGQPTETVFVRLHQDTGQVGEFDYPRNDPPVLDEDGRIATFSFLTNAGSFLLTADQIVTDTVTVPLVMAEFPAWLIVQADADGQPGEFLGQIAIDAGMFWDLTVPLQSTNLTPILFITLYQDADTPKVFDYPNGRDRPIRVGNSDVTAILQLLNE